MKLGRKTREDSPTAIAMPSQNPLLSEADSGANLDAAFLEGEKDELSELIKAKERQNQVSSSWFNVPPEQVENPQYWINL